MNTYENSKEILGFCKVLLNINTNENSKEIPGLSRYERETLASSYVSNVFLKFPLKFLGNP